MTPTPAGSSGIQARPSGLAGRAGQRERGAPMRDGTVLRGDVYRPSGTGPWPVLVCRTPYGKRGETFGTARYVSTATGLARRGYIVVVQDVRGRYASEGVYRWLYGPEAAAVHAQDGHDTIEWAATLPGSSGAVGTWGNSYDGYTSLRAAGAAPPSLSAAFASGVAERLHDETFGIFKPIYLEWTHAMAADLRARAGKPAAASFPPDMVWALPYDASVTTRSRISPRRSRRSCGTRKRIAGPCTRRSRTSASRCAI